ncbi:MAG: SPFH domain-containing protein [Acholeplasmatales bacterium]|nr:SPFH domain-containing protein [Acholeplasmatales bacterium]
MAFFELIKYDGNGINWLISKHPVTEFNKNSKLIVSPGQVAIIVHNGQIEKIVEEGTTRINSELLPFLKAVPKAFYGTNPYPIEIYFINKRIKLDLFWGTSDPLKLIDPKYNIQIDVRARGQMGIKLTNYQYFFQTLVGTLMKGATIDFNIIQSFFRGKINQIIKKILTDFFVVRKVTFFEIEAHTDEISGEFKKEFDQECEQFGFDLINFSIESINVPEDEFDKLNEILHKKAEFDQLGDQNYRTIRGYDVYEAGAKNNSGAATMMGVGMGMNMAGGMNSSQGGIIPPMNNEEAPKTEPKEKKTGSQFKCPNCGEFIDSSKKFCPECGFKLVHNCPSCNSVVDPSKKFCPECGQPLYKKEA